MEFVLTLDRMIFTTSSSSMYPFRIDFFSESRRWWVARAFRVWVR